MGEGITVRTMKDDVADLKGQPSSSGVGSDKAPKKELSPIPKKNPAKMGIIIGLIILVGIVGVGGWFGYGQFMGGNFSSVYEAPSSPITDVIPRDAVAIVAYNALTDANKGVISSYWANGLGPMAILSSTDARNLYYFTLANNSVPFIIIPKTAQTTSFLASQQQLKHIEKGGWYVIHENTVDDYIASISAGTYTGNSNASLLAGSGFVVRYVVKQDAVPAILSLPPNLGINRDQVIFDINQASQGDVVHGGYTISETAVPSTVIPDTTQLTALIPGDASFVRVGKSFAQDIQKFQQTHNVFDVSLFTEPAIQQYIAKLTTPYALYARTGVDGVPDSGLIIQLPNTLKPHAGYSDPVIEQLLKSFAPVIAGRALDSQIVFADGSYNALPIRYANLEGQTAALDYTVGDNFILVASSREGMQALGVMALGTGGSMFSNNPWNNLIKNAQSFVPHDMLAGSITDPAILSLLPGGQLHSMASLIVSTKEDNTGIHTDATVEFTK